MKPTAKIFEKLFLKSLLFRIFHLFHIPKKSSAKVLFQITGAESCSADMVKAVTVFEVVRRLLVKIRSHKFTRVV